MEKELAVDYEATDKLGFAATVGQNETFDHNYWSVGGSYAFNDNVSFDLTYHGVTGSTFSDADAVDGPNLQDLVSYWCFLAHLKIAQGRLI